MAEAELRRRIEAIRQQLFAVRERRVHPHKDDKILTDWNGLMIAALALAGRAFDEPRYAEAAQRAADFLLTTLRRPDGRLLHRFRSSHLVPPLRGGMQGLGRSGVPSSPLPGSVAGEPSDTAGQASRGTGIDTGDAAIPAFADDYAFLIWGLIELYETTFDTRHLQAALDLNRDFLAHFWGEQPGAFYSAADDAEGLLIRPTEIYDGAVPSANSVAMLDLLRLSRLTGPPDSGSDVATRGSRVVLPPPSTTQETTREPRVATSGPVATGGSPVGPYPADLALEEKASRIARAFAAEVAQTPMAYTQLLIALDFGLGPTSEVVIAGRPQADDTRAMLRALRTHFLPNATVLLRPTDQPDPPITRLAPFTREQHGHDGQATAYVCRNHACTAPTTDAAQMLESLGSDGAKGTPE